MYSILYCSYLYNLQIKPASVSFIAIVPHPPSFIQPSQHS